MKVAIIETDKGNIELELFPNEAPGTVANFEKLINEGFYDGLTFHRVIPNIVIQGGCPKGNGTGGPGYTIPAEIKGEDGKTLHLHKKGALAAARKGDRANPEKASSGSQFYIVQDARACAQLDGDYTVFGETVSGLDVVDKISAVATGARKQDLPNTDIKIISILPVK